MKQSIPQLTLNDGKQAPQLGFGVFQIDNDDVGEAISTALDAGYRSIDTAKIYENEEGVGKAIAQCSVARDEIFLTSKLWNDDQGFDSTLRAFETSLKKLATDYLDLYLIHWPVPSKDRYVECWKALVQLQKEGRIRSIGVSNFQPSHLERIIGETGVTPAVNQIEMHPDFAQREVVAFNSKHRIVSEAWSPLGQGGDLLKNATLVELGKKYGKSAAQVILRWHIEMGHMVIPKSETPERIRSNIDIFDFKLDEADMQAIAALDGDNRMGPDPDKLGS